MAGIDGPLRELRAIWEAVPAERRQEAADNLAMAMRLLAEGMRVLGPEAVGRCAAPALSFLMKAFTEVQIWKRPFTWVEERVQAELPGLLPALQAVAMAAGLDDLDAAVLPAAPVPPPVIDE